MSPSEPRRTIRIFPSSSTDRESSLVFKSVRLVTAFIPVCCAAFDRSF